jgi:hypothetical protein
MRRGSRNHRAAPSFGRHICTGRVRGLSICEAEERPSKDSPTPCYPHLHTVESILTENTSPSDTHELDGFTQSSGKEIIHKNNKSKNKKASKSKET